MPLSQDIMSEEFTRWRPYETALLQERKKSTTFFWRRVLRMFSLIGWFSNCARSKEEQILHRHRCSNVFQKTFLRWKKIRKNSRWKNMLKKTNLRILYKDFLYNALLSESLKSLQNFLKSSKHFRATSLDFFQLKKIEIFLDHLGRSEISQKSKFRTYKFSKSFKKYESTRIEEITY